MRNFILLYLLFILASCKTQPGSSRNNDSLDPNKTYKLQLNPNPGSAYYFDISNDRESKLELEDKKMVTESKNTVGVSYTVSKDSAGNFLMTMVYDKVRLYTKNGDAETVADADHATGSFNPTEKMLGYLKGASIVTTLSPSGELLHTSGYKEIGDKIMTDFHPANENERTIARDLWEKQIGNGLVKSTSDQLFKIFPDSAVHIGDTWRLSSSQEGEVPMLVKGTYTLKAINDDIAVIEANGTISSNNAAAATTGAHSVTTNLKGTQQAQFEMEAKTGMMISCRMKAEIQGTIEVMGNEVPVTIKTSVSVKGKRMTAPSH